METENTHNPLVSIIIPTYNRGGKIKSAINSILGQTYKNFELIVVDDGSTDNTEDIVKSFSKPNIIYLRTAQNKGACAARNSGIEKAQYELITFLDSDDYWEKDYLETHVEFYLNYSSKFKDFGLQFCSYKLSEEEGFVIMPSEKFDLSTKETSLDSLFNGNFISTQTIFTTKSVLNLVGKFDEKLPAFQDWDLVLRIASQFKILHLSKPLVNVIVSEDSITINHKKRLSSIYYLISKYKDSRIFSDKMTNKLYVFLVNYKVRFSIKEKLSFNIFSLITNKPFSIKSYYTFLKFFLVYKSLN